jgi:hypothetical protein
MKFTQRCGLLIRLLGALLGSLAVQCSIQATESFLSERNTEAPFCYLQGGTRDWPFLEQELPGHSRISFVAKRDGKVVARGNQLSFSGLEVLLNPREKLEIISQSDMPPVEFTLEVLLHLPDGQVESQHLSVRPAPPRRPISYLADFGDDLIRIFMDTRDGHWRPITKSGFDQYFRRCQAHGVLRLILWQSPFPYICDPKNYAPEHWGLYEKQTRAMLNSPQLIELINQLKRRGQSDPNWGLHIPWGWVRQLCALRLQRNLGLMISQSAAEHGIALTASFRPFETALTKYYEIPAFDTDGSFLWGFLPLATPTVNYLPKHTCFAHYRTILKEMENEAAGQIHAIEFNDVENATAFVNRFKQLHDNLKIVATNFPPLQDNSLILQRLADGNFTMRPFGEIKAQAKATRLVIKDYQLEQVDKSLKITDLDIPNDYRYLVLSNPMADEEVLEFSTLDPVRLWSKAGNRLGRENVFWVLDQSLDATDQTRVAGVPITGRDHTEFHATEASRKLLQNGPDRLPLRGHQLVIDLGATWSVEMMDLNRLAMRENAIKEMATLLKLPAFDELFINTRSHVSLAATKADGADGIRPLAHYSKNGKKIVSWLGIDRAYAPLSAASDPVLQAWSTTPESVENITTYQPGEWQEHCQSENSPFRWRYVRNREVAAGVHQFLMDLQQAFPDTRTRIVLPLPKKQTLATKDSLEKLLDANGKPYPRNYSSVWSTINHIRTIGEAMAMLRLDGLTAEPVLFGVRGLPDAAPLQLYLDQSFNDLHTNRGSGFRGPRSFFFEAQETLHATDPAAARGDRERIICELLAHPAKINEVILYEAADWLYKLPLDDADLCGHSFLDRCPSGEQ